MNTLISRARQRPRHTQARERRRDAIRAHTHTRTHRTPFPPSTHTHTCAPCTVYNLHFWAGVRAQCASTSIGRPRRVRPLVNSVLWASSNKKIIPEQLQMYTNTHSHSHAHIVTRRESFESEHSHQTPPRTPALHINTSYIQFSRTRGAAVFYSLFA